MNKIPKYIIRFQELSRITNAFRNFAYAIYDDNIYNYAGRLVLHSNSVVIVNGFDKIGTQDDFEMLKKRYEANRVIVFPFPEDIM